MPFAALACTVALTSCSSGGGGGGFGNAGGHGASGALGGGGGGAVGGQGGSGAVGGQGGSGARGGSGAQGGSGAAGGGGTSSCAPGMPTAFASTPASLSLPAARCGVAFDAIGRSSGALEYVLLDLGADNIPDLVVHQDDCALDVGKTRWDVYSGSATGLAATPQAFSLPAPRCGVAFDETARGSGALEYALLEVTGDGLVDLVVYQDDCDASIGKTHWDVYAASPSGFSATPVALSLPAARCGVAWDELGRGSGALEYVLMDMTGDKFADLVVYQDDCEAAIGQSRWDVYAGSASGFATTPTAYGVPAARCGVKWDEPSRSSGSLRYYLLDLTGDQRSDLVVARDSCDAAIGQSRWDVYPGGATSFAAGPSPYALPAARCGTSWDATGKSSSALRYSLFDASCDKFPDLVVTRDGCDTQVGASRWDVYSGSASGFSTTPANLAVPAPRCGSQFDGTSKSSSSLRYGMVSWLPTDRLGLLVSRDGCDATVGAAHWDYYVAK